MRWEALVNPVTVDPVEVGINGILNAAGSPSGRGIEGVFDGVLEGA